MQPTDWANYLAHVDAADPFYTALVEEVAAQQDAMTQAEQASAQRSVREKLRALALTERDAYLMDYLTQAVKQILGLAAHKKIARQQGLMNLGMDSLMAVELRNYLACHLELSLPATLLFDYPTLQDLQHYLLAELAEADPVVEQVAENDQPQPVADGDVVVHEEDAAQRLAQALNL